MVIVVPIFVPLIQPFPEIVRYQTVARGLFVLVYTIFDIDINFWDPLLHDGIDSLDNVSQVFWWIPNCGFPPDAVHYGWHIFLERLSFFK